MDHVEQKKMLWDLSSSSNELPEKDAMVPFLSVQSKSDILLKLWQEKFGEQLMKSGSFPWLSWNILQKMVFEPLKYIRDVSLDIMNIFFSVHLQLAHLDWVVEMVEHFPWFLNDN